MGGNLVPEELWSKGREVVCPADTCVPRTVCHPCVPSDKSSYVIYKQLKGDAPPVIGSLTPMLLLTLTLDGGVSHVYEKFNGTPMEDSLGNI